MGQHKGLDGAQCGPGFRCRPAFRWLGKNVAGVSSVMELFRMLMQEGRKEQVSLSSVTRAHNEVLSSRLVWFGLSCIFHRVDWKCRLDV